jgi:hypothetical protein
VIQGYIELLDSGSSQQDVPSRLEQREREKKKSKVKTTSKLSISQLHWPGHRKPGVKASPEYPQPFD